MKTQFSQTTKIEPALWKEPAASTTWVEFFVVRYVIVNTYGHTDGPHTLKGLNNLSSTQCNGYCILKKFH